MIKRTMERLPKGYTKVGEVTKQLNKGGGVAEWLENVGEVAEGLYEGG